MGASLAQFFGLAASCHRKSMIAKYNRKSLVLGVPGLLLQIGCLFLSNFLAAKAKAGGSAVPESLALLLGVGMIAGAVLLVIGLCFYAKAKGYSAVLGLLGLLSCIGLLILAVLPDKAKGQSDVVDQYVIWV
jgi:hypothetical protein